MNRLIKIMGSLLAFSMLVGCQENTSSLTKTVFGDFGYKGIFLKEYAVKEIEVEEAKGLVDISHPRKNPNYLMDVSTKLEEAKEDIVPLVLEKYGSLETTVKYYVDEMEEQQVRYDIFQGTDFKFLLETNHYEPFAQMSVRYLFVNDDLLDEMEKKNEEYKTSKQHLTSPFNVPFTYHTDVDRRLIVQTHSFAELPASINGGIGSTFRQDCELVFDEEGKITNWQSSLGLYTSTPTGTVKTGFIFEVEFHWNSK